MAWPPNSPRRAAMTFMAKESSWREAKRGKRKPATDDAALVPEAGEGPEIVVVAGLLEDLEPLGVGLEHSVLDPVVDHLGEVPGPGVTKEGVAILGRERLEHGLYVLEGVGIAPDHRAVADLVTPDTTAYPRVEPPEAAVPDPLGPHHGVAEVRVGPVDEDIARVGQLHELVYHLVGHVAGREHGPQHPR